MNEGLFPIDDDLATVPQVHCTLSGVKSIWRLGTNMDYYPLRDLSYALDWCLGGDPKTNGFIQRLDNYLLFFGSAFMIFVSLWLGSGTIGWAFLTAAILLVHPMASESFMWIAARKDVLALFFVSGAWLWGTVLFRRRIVSRLNLFWLVMLFAASLGAKAGTALIPLALLVFFICEHKRLTLPIWFGQTAFACTVLSAAYLALQKFQYSHFNPMSYPYTWNYRVEALAAALGRYTAGLVWFEFNTLDPINFWPWADINFNYIYLGLAAAALGLWYLWRERRSINRWLVLLPVMIYLVNPGPNIFHRNFYSVRYLLLSFWAFAVAVALLPRPAQRFRALLVGLLVFFLIQSYFEAQTWNQNLSVLEKGVKVNPRSPAARENLLVEQIDQIRWGHARASLKSEALNNLHALRDICRCQPEVYTYSNANLCFYFWRDAETLFRRLELDLGLDVACYAAEKNKTGLAMPLSALVVNAQPDPALAAEIETRENLPSPTHRFVKIAILCRKGNAGAARAEMQKFAAESLWDKEGFNEFLSELPLAERETLQNCLR